MYGRQRRLVNRDNQMIEEFKGPEPESDSEIEVAGGSLEEKRRRAINETEFHEEDCESDYED